MPALPAGKSIPHGELCIDLVGAVSQRSSSRRSLLPLIQEPRSFRPCRQEEVCDYADNDGRGTFDEKQPLPSMNAWIVDLEDSKANEPAERCRQQRTSEEHGQPETEFASGVEKRQVKYDTAVENPASKLASRRRSGSIPAKLVAAAWIVAIDPQPTMSTGSIVLAENRFVNNVKGRSMTPNGTLKSRISKEYWLPVKFMSLSMPSVLAFPILLCFDVSTDMCKSK